MGIITNNLTIGYQNPVLSDVNLSVNKGEILCVLGKNNPFQNLIRAFAEVIWGDIIRRPTF